MFFLPAFYVHIGITVPTFETLPVDELPVNLADLRNQINLKIKRKIGIIFQIS